VTIMLLLAYTVGQEVATMRALSCVLQELLFRNPQEIL